MDKGGLLPSSKLGAYFLFGSYRQDVNNLDEEEGLKSNHPLFLLKQVEQMKKKIWIELRPRPR